ncbi:Clp protease N-terminal domain-containing protein [Streptomyces sp. NPDC093097]|uniref:Clp protease N-terminal domain-containing protein n=1 Tax=Streptomyces sp. NPDC093097 TaxID=3366027 RepID=UPI0037F7B6A6
MFSEDFRLTEAAQHLLAAAQHEAAALGGNACGLEHLFLAAVKDPDGVPGRALAAFHLTYGEARAAVAAIRTGTAPEPADQAVEWAQVEDDLWPSRREIDEDLLLTTVVIRAESAAFLVRLAEQGTSAQAVPNAPGQVLARACTRLGLDLQRFERMYRDLCRRAAARPDPLQAPPTGESASLERAMERIREASVGKPGILERLDALERRLAELEARPPCRCTEVACEEPPEPPFPRSVGILRGDAPRDLAENTEVYLQDGFGR